MATEVKVRAAELTLVTVKLSAKILKQIPRLSYEQWRVIANERSDRIKRWKELKELQKTRPFTEEEGKEAGVLTSQSDPFIGWIHESAFNTGDYGPRLLVKTEEGQYGIYLTMEDTVKGLPQIYVV